MIGGQHHQIDVGDGVPELQRFIRLHFTEDCI